MQILFCVYNLLDYTYLNPLVDAFNAGVFVQVLMDDGNVQKPYVPTLKFFQNSGLNGKTERWRRRRSVSCVCVLCLCLCVYTSNATCISTSNAAPTATSAHLL